MTTAITLRRTCTINGTERGSNIALAVSAANIAGEQVKKLAAHPRQGWPVFGSARRHARHAAKVERLSR